MLRPESSFPVFWGVVGEVPIRPSAAVCNEDENEESVLPFASNKIQLWIRGDNDRRVAAWNHPESRENQPAVFVWGHPRIASDAEFGETTTVENVERAGLADHIGRMFERHGTEAFALLEGNFSLILSDPQSGVSYLVADKFGCDDIYIHAEKDYLAFASHPAYLLGANFRFDALPIAFFLAHEGFVPAPFTLFEGIRTVGRASFLRLHRKENCIGIEGGRYWQIPQSYPLRTKGEAISKFGVLIESAIETRRSLRSGLLLSGGKDSSLLLDIAARHSDRHVMALTGTVKGFAAGEQEIAIAKELANALHVPHESVVIDPQDETLPDEWTMLTESWMAGSRVMMPLFHRLAGRARSLLGEGCSVLSGQMADTLADNNYTFPSLGYMARRAFYSPWFLSLLPLIRALAPEKNNLLGKALLGATHASFGPRIAEMVRSVLGGVKNRREFYEGRVFGYGEMPGRSSEYFPSLTDDGFECIADWYSSQFVVPTISQLKPATFYRDMFELSLDMVMLHLDTRLVFQAFRLEQCHAEMPFLDSRVVNFFASLPYSARSICRRAKYVIRAQFDKQKLQLLRVNDRELRAANKDRGKGAEGLLLGGSLGAHFRDLLDEPTFPHRVPGIFHCLDERYCHDQIQLFREGNSSVNTKFVARLAALEASSRFIATRTAQVPTCATA
ncbi:MAG TPA: asparagine synthase-related protein [Candidatus Acidoferrales bacterium]|nr:asparagine synthase-related protein [Candidatus Acidoferrales bacterium]